MVFCCRVGIFKYIVWSTHFVSLLWSGISSIQLEVLLVLVCIKQLWGILSLWPEQWCLQGYGIIVGCTASVSRWISCTDLWIIFAWPWSLRLLQNCPFLSLSLWSMMCMMGSWSVCLVRHVLGDCLFQYNLLGRLLTPCCLHLICLSHKHGWL